jgi:hypothetical protein
LAAAYARELIRKAAAAAKAIAKKVKKAAAMSPGKTKPKQSTGGINNPSYNPYTCAHLGTNCTTNVGSGPPPDFYSFGGQVCVGVCVGASVTITKGGHAFFSLSTGFGLGVSAGAQAGFIGNPKAADHTPGYINRYIQGGGSARTFGAGPFSMTQSHGNLASDRPGDYAIEPGVGVGADAGMSQTWSYSWDLGQWGGPATGGYNKAFVCAHDGVCG